MTDCFGTLIGVAYFEMGIFSLLNIGLTEESFQNDTS